MHPNRVLSGLVPRPSCPQKPGTAYYKAGDDEEYGLVRVRTMDRVSHAERAIMVQETCSLAIDFINVWFPSAVQAGHIDTSGFNIVTQKKSMLALIAHAKTYGLHQIMQEFHRETGQPGRKLHEMMAHVEVSTSEGGRPEDGRARGRGCRCFLLASMVA